MNGKLLLLVFTLVMATGCQAPLAVIPNRQQEISKIALGNVQSNLKKGVASSLVIENLGSPNIITSNSDGTESWVYDKISTETESANGWSGNVTSKSTRTMIVFIKFDSLKNVEDIKYRQTSY